MKSAPDDKINQFYDFISGFKRLFNILSLAQKGIFLNPAGKFKQPLSVPKITAKFVQEKVNRMFDVDRYINSRTQGGAKFTKNTVKRENIG
ncbi:MAG: hypothetical protein IT269_01525 [Saprospiraceae bacterium]|nr:hypothetical protein [Saprospiraceae bacterium]